MGPLKQLRAQKKPLQVFIVKIQQIIVRYSLTAYVSSSITVLKPFVMFQRQEFSEIGRKEYVKDENPVIILCNWEMFDICIIKTKYQSIYWAAIMSKIL